MGPVASRRVGMRILADQLDWSAETTNTAVAFAGDVEPSFNLIKNLYAELSPAPEMDVCQRLLELYKQVIEKTVYQTPPDCEFLVRS
jgi:hypothetical protein